MNFVPTEMAFLRPEVSQKDLVSSWFWSLTLVLDSENLSCHSMSFSSCGMESLVCV